MIGLGIHRRSALRAITLSGTAFPGETLTASRAGQWYADGVAISGQTGSSYTVGLRDIGKSIRCGGSGPVTIWHPRDITGVMGCWVPFANVLTSVGPDVQAADGQTVHTWAGIINSTLAQQTSSALQPVFRATDAVSGLPAVEFNGSHLLPVLSGFSWFQNVRIREVIVAVRDTNLTGGAASHIPFFEARGTGALSSGIYTRSATNGNVFEAGGRMTDDTGIIRANTSQSSGWNVIRGFWDGINGLVGIQKNADSEVTTAATATATSNTISSSITIGNTNNGANGFPGPIACVIECSSNSNLSARDLRRLRQFAGLCANKPLGLSVA